MKTKIKLLFIFSMLLLSVEVFASSVSITAPTNNQTLYITSGTSKNITMKWSYGIDVGVTSWYFKVKTLGDWEDPDHNNKTTVANVSSGTYTWKIRMYTINTSGTTGLATDYVTFTVTPGGYTITAQNNFSGGQIKVGVNGSATPEQNPHEDFSVQTNDVVNLEGINNQVSGGYTRIWNAGDAPLNESDWWKKEVGYNFEYFDDSKATNFTVNSSDDGAIYQANFRKVCNVTFKNSFVSVGNGGQIKINGISESSPTGQHSVIELNEISATAINHTINGINYTFAHWDDGNTSKSRTFTPTNHHNYVASFNGKPVGVGSSVTFNNGAPNGTPIKLYWNDNVNPTVKYKIYRKHGKFGSTELIATVNSGVETYTDYGLAHTNNTSTYNLTRYDVRAYYPTENSYATSYFKVIYAELFFKQNGKKGDSTNTAITMVKENSITNFPNPFNPTTIVYYKLKEQGNVVIKVYDMLGKEVAELVNEKKSMGEYVANFNGSNLSSGVYIMTMQINNFSTSKKILLTK